MFAQGEDCLFGQKRIAVVAKRIRNFLKLLLLLIADDKLRRRNARKLVQQRLSILRLGQSELPRAEIGIREAKDGAIGINCAQIIGALGFEQIEITHRACADDLSDIARNNFSRLRFADLITDRHAPPGLDQLCDVRLRSVIRHAAHRHAVALGQCDV